MKQLHIVNVLSVKPSWEMGWGVGGTAEREMILFFNCMSRFLISHKNITL